MQGSSAQRIRIPLREEVDEFVSKPHKSYLPEVQMLFAVHVELL